MCFACAEAMRNELSAESKQRLEAFFIRHVNPEQKAKHVAPQKSPFQKWISISSLIKQSPIKIN